MHKNLSPCPCSCNSNLLSLLKGVGVSRRDRHPRTRAGGAGWDPRLRSCWRGGRWGSPAGGEGEGAAQQYSLSFAAGSSLQSSPDFAAFPKLEQPEEDKYSKSAAPTPPAPPSPTVPEPPKADLFEQKVVFSGFGPIMRFSTSTSSAGRARAPSPGDYKSPHGSGAGASAGTHKRMPVLSATLGPAEEAPETALKEKKHKASKRSRHGPGRPKGGRGKEGGAGPTASLPAAQLAGFTATAASPFSGGSLVSSGLGGLASRTFGPSGSLPSLSLESSLLGAG